MKKSALVLGIISLLVAPSLFFAQAEAANYLKLDYIKVAPVDVQDFIEHMRSDWIPLHQKRVESGEIDSWSLYRVEFPGGAKSEYNFVSMTAASGLDKFESSEPREILSSLTNTKQTKTIMAERNRLSTVMFSEVWKVINKIAAEKKAPNPGKYLMMDYMNVVPGKESEYQLLEDELARPIHQERVETDKMQGWEVYSLISPGGTEYGYNFATGNFFNDLANVEFGFTEEVIESAIPGTNIPEMFDTIFSTRSLVRSEVWERVAWTK